MSGFLKIAIVTPFYPTSTGGDAGGIGNHFRHLALGFKEAGHGVEVFQFPYTGEFQGSLEVEGVSVHRHGVRMPSWFNFRGLGRLARITGYCDRYPSRGLYNLTKKVLLQDVQAGGFDVIEATSNRGLPFSYCKSAGKRLPVITRVSTTMAHHFQENCESPDVNQLKEAWYEQQLLMSCDALVTHTDAHAKELEQELGVPTSRFEIIPHGIDIPADSELRLRGGQNSMDVKVLYVGRFEKRKGVDVLLAAIPKILAVCPNARFQLAGNDPDGKWEEQFSKGCEEQVLQRVEFLGRVSDEDKVRLYQECDVFAAPSRYESFGLVYVEAMAWGKPVVGCQAGGVPEVVGEEGGLLALPGDAGSLVTELVALIKDRSLREKMGEQARKRVTRLFSREKMAQDTVKLYHRVLSRKL